MARVVLTLCFAFGWVGCGEDGPEPSLLPPDYADTYQEVRNCRFSIDHDLIRMRVLASPDALAVYQARNTPFPTGAIVVKEDYDSADEDCEGPILGYTVMQKLDTGTAPADLDWRWQEADAELGVKQVDLKRCTNCHTSCGKPPGGFDGTCTEP